MSGYSQTSNPYPDAPPAEEYRQQAGYTSPHTDRQGHSLISWWRSWGERTFYLLVFVAFVALLVTGGAWL